MGYIGNEPTTGHFPVQTNLAGDGSARTFTMNRAPATIGSIEVSVQGIIQPTTAYTISGTTLTLPAAGTVIANGVPIFIRYLGETLSLPTPADGSVTATKLGVNAITEDKLYISNAGSNGEFLSKQSGATGGLTWAAAGGAWTFISSVTASSSATVNFLSSFSSTYDIYKLFMTAVTPATDGAEPTVRYAIGGAARSTSGDYRWVTDGGRDADNTTGAAQIMASNSATYIRLGNSGGTATGEQNFCEFTIYGVNDTDNHKACTWHMGGTGNGGQTRVYTGSAKLDAVTTAISGIQFLYSTGNVASGEFYLYGLNKS